ncbi:hypothetical protein PPEP_a4097 [Pseudoalteromonas peptidolytica F12-50-A1]|uniref:Uncharacterized protein n=1 Tax=Pseudoalteromonas peptidolytica F12-50-A1 TaxID=1315280 RepID=A0A8I0T1H7_9GAMM|nr:hypothetical protein [Pseudoalteromonas peptidolytica F12-50-A1]
MPANNFNLVTKAKRLSCFAFFVSCITLPRLANTNYLN